MWRGRNAWGQGERVVFISGTLTVSVIPEAAALELFGVALAGLGIAVTSR
jgi:hypothetical protein